jgi:hypothetical protein
MPTDSPKSSDYLILIADDAAEMRSIRRSYLMSVMNSVKATQLIRPQPALENVPILMNSEVSSIDREEMCGSGTGITVVGITGKNAKEGLGFF